MPGANFRATFGTVRGRNPAPAQSCIFRALWSPAFCSSAEVSSHGLKNRSAARTLSLIVLRAILRVEIKCPLLKVTVCS